MATFQTNSASTTTEILICGYQVDQIYSVDTNIQYSFFLCGFVHDV